MPAPATVQEFLELVQKSSVVDDNRLKAYLTQLKAGNQIPAEPNKLAGLLIREGLLTYFQAEQFLQGRWKRFHIGRYKVLERLGAGGMGQVFLCEHKLMRRRVAVKVLPTNKAEDASSLERFYREARAVAALDHPNIVRAYDIDQDENLHFLVMEYVDGNSLQDIVKKHGPMDILRACHYMSQAAYGLQHAHEAGLVHRDIKPGNLLIDRQGTMKILDMGLARFFHDEEDMITKRYDESVLGTADYLAPEQVVDSHSVDIRADIYSLGATFYFMLANSPPFHEGSVAQKLIWHQTREPRPISTLRPEIAPELAAVIEMMMVKDPANRYQTPGEVIDALAPFVQTPIGLPPDREMPLLCLAAQGRESPPSTQGATQLRSNAPPAPPAVAAPITRSSPTRSSAELPTMASPPPVPRQQSSPTGAAPTMPRSPASRSPTPARQPHQPTGPAQPSTSGRPQPAPMNDPYQPVWENLNHETTENSHSDTDRPHHQARPDSGMSFPGTSGSFAAPMAQQPTTATLPRSTKPVRAPRGDGLFRKRTLWIGLAVVAGMVTVAILFLRGDGKSNSQNTNLTQATIGPGGQYATLKEAIDRRRPEQKELLLLGDLTDGPIRISGANTDGITIRPFDKDRVIAWTPGPLAGPADYLLRLDTLRNFRISGIDFKLGDKFRGAIEIKGVCAGMSLKDLQISGGKDTSLMLGCKGTKEAPIQLQNLRITNLGPKSAIELQSGVNHLRIDDCTLIGDRERSISGLFFAGSFDEVELSRLRIWRFTDGILIPNLKDGTTRRFRLSRSTFSDLRSGLSVTAVTSTISPKVELQFENNYFAKSGTVIWYTSDQGVWSKGTGIRGELNGTDSTTSPIDAKITNPNNAKPEQLIPIQVIEGTFSTDESNLDTFLRPDPESPLGKSKIGYPAR